MSTQPPKPKRRWYQFSLKTLLVVMTVATLSFGGWVQYMRYRAQENRERMAKVEEAVAAIEELGGAVTSEYKDLRPQTWLERQFDDPGDAVDPVGVLQVTKVHFVNIKAKVTDDALEHVGALSSLEDLYLSEMQVTDAGLQHLRGLSHLRSLNLGYTQVTDAGLKQLTGLKKLQTLDLFGTKVTDDGVKKLQQALPNCMIRR